MSFIMLILGFIFLIKGADFLVDSSSKLAKMYGISSFIIGLSVVALGTSAPEAAIGVISGIKQNNNIILGTILGSSIANIALIIGLTATIMPIEVNNSNYKKDMLLAIAAQLVLFLLVSSGNIISRFDSIILIILFVLFFLYIISKSKNSYGIEPKTNDSHIKPTKKLKLFILIIIGMIGLVVGGDMVVENGTKIASMMGLSETFIGISVVAIGTSLPELVTSIVAALKKEPDIVLGNIIGSNIFNVLFVLGLSSLVYPINASPAIRLDLIIMIFVSVLLFLFSASQKRISRREGISFFILYISYIIFAYFSGSGNI
ncbi:UNVERIFIED_CONTAM: cation:H+ antiporter [Acetivibrio alkalicellulosi]